MADQLINHHLMGGASGEDDREVSLVGGEDNSSRQEGD